MLVKLSGSRPGDLLLKSAPRLTVEYNKSYSQRSPCEHSCIQDSSLRLAKFTAGPCLPGSCAQPFGMQLSFASEETAKTNKQSYNLASFTDTNKTHKVPAKYARGVLKFQLQALGIITD